MKRLLLFAAAFGLAIYGLFRPFHHAVDREFWERLMDSVHLPLFFVLALVTARTPVFPKWRGLLGPSGSGRRAVATAIFLTAFAGAVEIIQPRFGRSESLVDFGNGVAGIALALLGLELWRRPGHALRPLYLAAVAAAALATLFPAGRELRAIAFRAWNFPVLGDFESPLEMTAWHGTWGGAIRRSREHAASGRHSLEITLGHGGLPGVECLPGRSDWRGFRALEFDAYNPGAPFALVLRVDDDGPLRNAANRAHWTGTLAPGWNHVAIPLSELEHAPKSRLLNLAKIRRIVFFVENPPAGLKWNLDRLRLTRRAAPSN